MAGDRYLLVHGHFYQPPRENPWTGQIDPQHSAAPWENWNRRIADECYLPMARSRVYDDDGKVVDLYNNYAHTSFNFGPTLLSWVEGVHPELLRHLADATILDRTFAMAQAYSHAILPLSDARERHVQVVWGLKEFHHRFGFYPNGMWLSESGIDTETVRALIDHRVRYVILSPHQASRARPFGSQDWHDVGMGAIDTRRAYRLFDIDGGGRTHFERYLDVVFYTPGLNLKVSFDHILNRPEDLARELENCYRDTDDAQLVSIVTDGEIYGHHEKHGEEALSRLFRDIAPKLGLKVVSAGEFIRDNPPTWEVKLWNGEDGRGSSWSCAHGVGRWYRDCGCHSPCPQTWNQAWRGPFRDALDAVRHRVRLVARQELGPLLWDVDEACMDYVDVILTPTFETRRRFVTRHASHELSIEEVERLWRLLEALHNSVLMYASCGWFFDELSGLEPVQNMRYALRAAELVQPWLNEDLTLLLERELTRAVSNIERFRDGGAVFRDLVLPSRHDNRELAAALAVCAAANFPTDGLSWRIVDSIETTRYNDSDGNCMTWGSFVAHDRRLDRFIKTAWIARVNDLDNTIVFLHGYDELQCDPYEGTLPPKPDSDFGWLQDIREATKNMSTQELLGRIGDTTIPADRLPAAVRAMLYRKFAGDDELVIIKRLCDIGKQAVPFLDRARRRGATVPAVVERAVSGAFEIEMDEAVIDAIEAMDFAPDRAYAILGPRDAAWHLGVGAGQTFVEQALATTGRELLHWLSRVSEKGWFDSLEIREPEPDVHWLMPTSESAHHLRYPEANRLSLAVGKGLYRLHQKLRVGDPDRDAVLVLPLPELLEYMDRLGFPGKRDVALGMAYWDFLDRPLRRLLRLNGEKLLAGPVGDRIRAIGDLLGFASDIIDERIDKALTARG